MNAWSKRRMRSAALRSGEGEGGLWRGNGSHHRPPNEMPGPHAIESCVGIPAVGIAWKASRAPRELICPPGSSVKSKPGLSTSGVSDIPRMASTKCLADRDRAWLR